MKSIEIVFSLRKFTIFTITILILIYVLLVIGVILGRSYYSEIRLNFIYPVVILKEYFDSNKDFLTIVKKEIDYIVNPVSLSKVNLKINQNTKDDLEKDLLKIKASGNVLGDKFKKYYNFKILKNNKNDIKGKFRLKGNLPGHRSINYFPSINVKLKKDKTYLGMTDFSIHSPIPKRNLWEPLSFLFYRDQGILSPISKYIDLRVNETKYGVHLINERISKKFLEGQKRRLGPIIEMENKLPQNDFDLNGFKLFNQNSISLRSMFQNNNSDLTIIRSNALKKLKLYTEKLLSPEEVFDLNILAKMVAIKDLLLDPELIFNEIKWYYNPLTSLFEPIDFDPHSGTSTLNGQLLIKVGSKFNHQVDPLFRPILENLNFISLYQKHIKRYSSINFLSNFFKKHEQYFIDQEKALQQKFSRRHVDYFIAMKNLIFQRAKLIKKVLNYNKTLNASYNLNKGILEFHFDNISNSNYYNLTDITLLDHNMTLKDKIIIPPLSKLKHSISILDFISVTKINTKDDSNKIISNFYNNLLEKTPKKQRSFIFFENKGSTKDINFKIIADRRPVEQLRNIKNITAKTLKSLPMFLKNESTVSGNKIIVHGKIIFKESYNFSNVLLELRPGSSLVFENGAVVKFNNGFRAIGRKDKRISIESMDGSGAIIFRDQGSKTLLQNTDIKNFDLKKTYQSDLLLTSPITFYNSNLEIIDSNIINIKAEDSMNIVASTGKIDNLFITKNQLSDCLDIDFSEIKIQNIFVSECGNDGLDFSYSNIFAENIQVNQTGDKAISIGEKSKVNFDKIKISNSKIGIASKDGSVAILNEVYLKNVDYGLVVYNKKFGFKTPFIHLSKVKNEGESKLLFSKYLKGEIFMKKNPIKKLENFPKAYID